MIDQINTKLAGKFKSASLILSGVAIAFGFSVFIGYTLEALVGASPLTHILKTVFPQLPVAMNPATAAAFILSGSSGLMLMKGGDKKWLLWIAFACAALTMAIGLVKLVGIFSGHDVYFDKFMYSAQLQAEGLVTGRPNQIAPNTALNFTLVGAALILLHLKKHKAAQYLASATFFIGLLAVLGYAYGVSKLIGIAQYIPMALNTAVAFECISLSILLAFPGKGIMTIAPSDSAGGIISRRLIPAAIILPAILGYVTFFSQSAGYYPPELGLALLIVASIVIFTVLIWREAIVIHKVDTELKEQKANSDALLESIGDGIIATDSAFKILVINPAAETMLGWSSGEAIEKNIGAGFPVIQDETGNMIPFEKQPFMKTLKTGKKIQTDITSKDTYYYVRKDGTRFPVAITATPVALEGKTIGVIVVFRDITIEKEFEQKKSEFISLASHQLKTPPTALRWNLEMLMEDEKDFKPQHAEAIRGMYDMTKKMMDTVNSLLNISRLEMGSFIVDPKPTDYAEVSREIIKEQKQKIDSKKIKIEEFYDPQLPLIPADPGLAKIIVENLISNAVKYTPDNGTVRVSIKYLKESSNIRIEVSDTGYGIPKNQQGQIFTKMFRADNVKSTSEGTGFGLYLLKSIVENSEGKIWFESEERKGTTFYIELPITGMKKKVGTSHLSKIE